MEPSRLSLQCRAHAEITGIYAMHVARISKLPQTSRSNSAELSQNRKWLDFPAFAIALTNQTLRMSISGCGECFSVPIKAAATPISNVTQQDSFG